MQQAVCFWVIDESFLKAKSNALKSDLYSNIGNLVHHIMAGDAILISHFDFEKKAAQINSIGIIEEVNINEEKMIIETTSCDFLITPGPNGRRHWQKFFFALNADRVYHYELPTFFANILNNPEWLDVKIKDHSTSHYNPDLRKPSLHVEEGYVYIWQYKDEYKIGKAVDVDRRKKQVTYKTGRQTKEIHRIFSSDYSRAEALLHKRFQEKRLYGEAGIEWFLLDPEDIDWLKSISVFEDIENEIN